MEEAKAARLAMTWKDRQRQRLPLVDVEDNPFCVERRTNEEFHMMRLNKNPSLVHLTSADIPRTASFMVDDEKPFREFSRKKRNLLAWSLRAASASDIAAAAAQGTESRKTKPNRRMSRSKTVPSNLGETEVAEFFNQTPSTRRPPDRADIDIDTLPNLEPYRREVVAQQPITFGHRPLSASRMFNPCTMATSCGVMNGGHSRTVAGNAGGRKVGASRTRRGAARTKQQPHLNRGKENRGRHNQHRSTGLSAPMLKALLKGNPQVEGGAAAMVEAVAPGFNDSRQESFDPCGENIPGRKDLTAKAKYLVVDGHEDLSDSSINSDRLNESMWRSVDPAGGGVRGNLEATWLTNSSLGGIGQHRRGGLGGSTEEVELQRIFSEERPPWDGTPVPLPAPRNVRRAISSLLMPDPDERLRDKLIKSRKAAAGIPVTASSIKDERDKEVRPLNSPSGRWEVGPATPRTVIAHEEIRKLAELRRERDSVMAKRVRQAELSVFFNKIAPSEKLYRNTLQVAKARFQHLGAAAA